MDNEKSLQEYNIRAGTMIQVYQKQYDMEFKSEQASSEQIQKAVTCYRNIFKEMASSSTAVLNSKKTSIQYQHKFKLNFFPIENNSARDSEASS